MFHALLELCAFFAPNTFLSMFFLQSYKHGDPSHGKITSPKLIKSETFFYYNISNLDINSNFICFEKHVKI